MKSNGKHTKHLPKSKIAEAYGWLGSGMILTAYALLSLGILNGNSLMYHGIFFVGSSGLAVVTYRHRAYQSLLVNVFFTLLALTAMARIVYFS